MAPFQTVRFCTLLAFFQGLCSSSYCNARQAQVGPEPPRTTPASGASDKTPSSTIEKKSTELPADNRRFWRYNAGAGGGYFRVLANGKWEEIAGTDEPGALRGIWEELSRTADYVELFDPKRNYKTRLGAGKAWLASGKHGTYGPSPHGDWEQPVGPGEPTRGDRAKPNDRRPVGSISASENPESLKDVNGDGPDYAKMKADWKAKADAPIHDKETTLQAVREELTNAQKQISKAQGVARPAIEGKLRAAREVLIKAQEDAKQGKPTPEQKLELSGQAAAVKRLERELQNPTSEAIVAFQAKVKQLEREVELQQKAVEKARAETARRSQFDDVNAIQPGYFGKIGGSEYAEQRMANGNQGMITVSVPIGPPHYADWRVLQVLDKTHALLAIGRFTFYAELDTTTLTDGRTIRPEKFVHCYGTNTYKSGAGIQRTVNAIRFAE
jgi:hypothetical protein